MSFLLVASCAWGFVAEKESLCRVVKCMMILQGISACVLFLSYEWDMFLVPVDDRECLLYMYNLDNISVVLMWWFASHHFSRTLSCWLKSMQQLDLPDTSREKFRELVARVHVRESRVLLDILLVRKTTTPPRRIIFILYLTFRARMTIQSKRWVLQLYHLRLATL